MARAIVAILLLGLGTGTTAGEAPTVSAKGSDLVLNPGSPNGQTIIQDSEGKATLTSSMIKDMATMSQVQSAMDTMSTKLDSYVLSSQLPGSPADIATMDKVQSLLQDYAPKDYTPPTPANVVTQSIMTDYVQQNVLDDLDVLKDNVEALKNSPPSPPSGGGGGGGADMSAVDAAIKKAIDDENLADIRNDINFALQAATDADTTQTDEINAYIKGYCAPLTQYNDEKDALLKRISDNEELLASFETQFERIRELGAAGVVTCDPPDVTPDSITASWAGSDKEVFPGQVVSYECAQGFFFALSSKPKNGVVTGNCLMSTQKMDAVPQCFKCDVPNCAKCKRNTPTSETVCDVCMGGYKLSTAGKCEVSVDGAIYIFGGTIEGKNNVERIAKVQDDPAKYVVENIYPQPNLAGENKGAASAVDSKGNMFVIAGKGAYYGKLAKGMTTTDKSALGRDDRWVSDGIPRFPDEVGEPLWPFYAQIDDVLYVWGGENTPDVSHKLNLAADPLAYQAVAKPPTARKRGCTAIDVSNQKIFTAGGYKAIGNEETDVFEIYDAAADSWSSGTPLLQPRVDCGSGFIDNTVYVYGGTSFSTSHSLYSLDVSAGTSGKWVEKKSIPAQRGEFSALAWDNKLWAVGSHYTEEDKKYLSYYYDPKFDKWYKGPIMGYNRGAATIMMSPQEVLR